MRLFVDMDGVLTDFNRQFREWFGEDIEVCRYKDDPRVRGLIDWYMPDAPPEFWGNMPWLPGAREFWLELGKWNPEILSAPYNRTQCVEGKLVWCKRELYPSVAITLEPDKFVVSNPGDILIDDSAYNAHGWRGAFILHENPEKTLSVLRGLLGS